MTVLDAPETARPPDRRARRLAALAAGHGPFAVAVVVGVLLRATALAAYRPALFYVDSFRYINNTQLEPDWMAPAGYAAVVQAVLRIGDLGWIPPLHHALGLAMAVALYVLARRWGAPGWVATLGVLPLLLDGYQLQSETRIMPETVFQALLVAAFAVLAWRRRPALWQVAVAALLVGLATPVRLVGVVLVPPFLLAAALSSPTRRQAVARTAVALVLAGAPIALYGAYVHAETGHVGLGRSDMTARMLYARVARFVDCDVAQIPDRLRSLCPTDYQQRTLPTDDFAWAWASPVNQYGMRLDWDTRFEDVGEFGRAALRSDPGRFVGLALQDFLKNFAWTKETFAYDMPVERWRFPTSLPLGADVDFIADAYDRFGGGPSRVRPPLARVLRGWQLGPGRLPGTLLAGALILGLAGGAVALVRRWRSPVSRTHAAACLLFTGAGLALLAAPALYQFSWRYQLPTLVLAPAGAALGVAALRRDAPGADHAPPDAP